MLRRLLPALVLGLTPAALVAQQSPATLPRAESARPALQVKLYSVAELVVPLTRAEGAKKTTENDLVKLLTSTVAPTSWSPMGGPGSMEYYPQTMSLVVNQTPAVHEQLAELLQSLRRLQDVQVALEVRLVSVGESFRERLGIDFDVNVTTDCKGKTTDVVVSKAPCCAQKLDALGTKFLNEVEVHQLLEAVQGDQRTHVMFAPKLTVLNGQQASVQVTEEQNYVTDVSVVKTGDVTTSFVPKTEPRTTGFQMTVQPVVSADRRHVQLYIQLGHSELASHAVPLFPVQAIVQPSPESGTKGKPVVFTQYVQQPTFNVQTIEKTVAIPDGGTVIFGGLKKTVETRQEFGPPVLSKVPYVNRLFKNVGVGRESREVFVLVTPRVIIGEEEECVKCPTGRFAEMAALMLKKEKSYHEEQEVGCRDKTCPEPTRHAKAVAELLKAYEAACVEGRTDEAERLARAALIVDPTCFSKVRR